MQYADEEPLLIAALQTHIQYLDKVVELMSTYQDMVK